MEINALHDVSFDVERGEWIGLYGRNGAGKSTLLKILAGLLPADRGEYAVHGSISSFLDLGIGFHEERAARENLQIHCLLHGLPHREIPAVSDRILAFADIGEHEHLPLKCYSTGMRLRLGFAAAAQMHADIYLFDEILAVGDQAFQEKCAAYLRSLREAGKTVLMVSHDLAGLQGFCDRIVHIENGGILKEEKGIPDAGCTR